MRWLVAAAVLLALSSACGGAGTPGEPELLVGAASSMEPLFRDLGPAFERESGAKVTFVYGSSGSLAVQIERGAPIDVFAAANPDFVTSLVEQGLVLNDRETSFAEGRLVAIASFGPDPHTTWRDAVIDSHVRYVAIANPEVAPYGAAARRALQQASLWETLRPKLVYGENVGQVLQFVQSGNADVGFVALAQIAADHPEGLTSLPVDRCEHGPLPQVIARLERSARPALAERFFDFVGSSATKQTLERHGYTAANTFEGRSCE